MGLEEDYAKFQMLQKRTEELGQNVELITQQLNGLLAARASIEELSKIKEGGEVLAQITPGIFFRAEIKDRSKLILNAGSDSMVQKSPEETISFINKQITETEKAHSEINKEFRENMQQAQLVYNQLIEAQNKKNVQKTEGKT